MIQLHVYLTEGGAEELVKGERLNPYHFYVRVVRADESEWEASEFKNKIRLTREPITVGLPGSMEAIRAAMAGLDASIEHIRAEATRRSKYFEDRKESLKLIGFDGASVKVVE